MFALRYRTGLRPALAAACALILAALPPAAPARAGDDRPASGAGVRVLGSGPDVITVGAGLFNFIPNDNERVVEDDDVEGEARFEYRLGRKWLAIGPMLGIMANTEDGVFGYGALYMDIRAGRWAITPAAGLGGYAEGDGKDLGGVFQFHVGVDVAYVLESGARLGMKFAHISNAHIHDENPGAESLLLTFTMPMYFFRDGRV